MKRILVAGIGNIFAGDDGFGVETVRRLRWRALPEEVRVVDFGIRSYDLAYAIADGYHAVIMVDATPRDQQPGTLYLIEPDLDGLDSLESEAVDAHSMNPVAVLQMARSLGGKIGRVYLVGCEPADLGGDEGRMGLSEEVDTAVPKAVELVQSLVGDLLGECETAGSVLTRERS